MALKLLGTDPSQPQRTLDFMQMMQEIVNSLLHRGELIRTGDPKLPYTINPSGGGGSFPVGIGGDSDGSGGGDGSGPMGPPGQRGADGAIGPMGPPGQDADGAGGGGGGDGGSMGPPGLPGAAGTAGAMGPPGVIGVDGEEGMMGPPGFPGAAGATGATGDTGPAGAAGAAGANGGAGSSGPPGMSGNDGDDGSPGLTGLRGAPGAAGLMGPPGNDGSEAESWIFVQGRTMPVDPGICGGRLTLNSATPVSVVDLTALGTICFARYRGNQIALLKNSSVWDLSTIPFGLELALTITSGKNYDVFVYDNSGTLTLELSAAWTSDIERADEIALTEGVWLKLSNLTRRYLGTIRASGTNTTEDSLLKRFVWNAQNRMPRKMLATEDENTWDYTTATFREAFNQTTNRLQYVVGLSEEQIECNVLGMAQNSTAGVSIASGIGIDSTTVNSADLKAGLNAYIANTRVGLPSFYKGWPGIGFHFLSWLEYSGAGVGTTTWFGDGGAPTFVQAGISGTVWG